MLGYLSLSICQVVNQNVDEKMNVVCRLVRRPGIFIVDEVQDPRDANWIR